MIEKKEEVVFARNEKQSVLSCFLKSGSAAFAGWGLKRQLKVYKVLKRLEKMNVSKPI